MSRELVDISKSVMVRIMDGRVVMVSPDHPPIVINPDGSAEFLEFPKELPQ